MKDPKHRQFNAKRVETAIKKPAQPVGYAGNDLLNGTSLSVDARS